MSSGNLVRFRFINNMGGGFAKDREVFRNTTVGEFLDKELGGVDLDNYTIRYTPRGGTPDLCEENQVIEEGSRVSCAAAKIEGAI